MKICKECKINKDEVEYYKNPNVLSGILNQCKECVGKRLKKYRNDNILLLKEKRKIQYYNNRGKNIKDAIEWGRKNKGKRDEAKRKWRLKNKELTNHLTKGYHSRRKGAVGEHSLLEWNRLCELFGNKCLSCGLKVKLTKDHIVPLSKGGTDYIENIQPLCISCNSKKGNREIINYKNKI